jgi:hypothetical protein
MLARSGSPRHLDVEARWCFLRTDVIELRGSARASAPIENARVGRSTFGVLFRPPEAWHREPLAQEERCMQIRNRRAGQIEALPRTTRSDLVRTLIEARGYQRYLRVQRGSEHHDALACRDAFVARWDQRGAPALPNLGTQPLDLVFLDGSTHHEHALSAIDLAIE